MNVQCYRTSDPQQGQVFKCCTLPQNILTPPKQQVNVSTKDKFLAAA